MSSHNHHFDMYEADALIPDPGNAGTIYVIDKDRGYVELVSTTTETRTLARPTKAGKTVTIYMRTDGGDVTLTVTGGFEQSSAGSDDDIVFNDAGDYAVLESINKGGTYEWRLRSSDGVSGPVEQLGSIDLNGEALILDADADTSITADTDDQIDFALGGTDHVVFQAVASADAGVTRSLTELIMSTPADTSGTNNHYGLTIDIEVGNATGGTNTVRAIQIDGITADAEVTEEAINIGAGWPTSLACPDDSDVFLGTGSDAGLQFSTAGTADALVLFVDNTSQHLHVTDRGARATAWTVSAGTDPTVYLHSNTTPDSDYLAIGAHDGTNASINMVGGTGLDFQIDSIGALRMDDAAIASFAAATDAAGTDVYIETQDAGSTPTVSRAGGLLKFKTGDGAASANTVVGGPGGASANVAGNGGANTGGGATGAGGAGGAQTITAGTGGNTNNTGTDNGGAGGDMTLTAGTGGNATAGTGDGGAGGDITIVAGLGGSTTGGVAGAPGKVKVDKGLLHYTNGQTIDMSDAQVVLTLVPGTPTGTTVTSNLLFVDANSTTTEDLLLPPEADCNGLMLHIANTGGEDIVVKEDGDAVTICTISTAQVGMVFCDGTTWYGGIMPQT